MEVLDDFIQILFDIIDKLFWFNPEIGPRKLKKMAVFIIIIGLILYIYLNLLIFNRMLHLPNYFFNIMIS